MSEAVGLQPEQVALLNSKLHGAANTLAESAARIDRAVSASWWAGATATNFRFEWRGVMHQRMRTSSVLLESAARLVERQRNEQIAASAAGGPGAVLLGNLAGGSPVVESLHLASHRLNQDDFNLLRGRSLAGNLVESTEESNGKFDPGHIPADKFRVVLLEGEPPRAIIVLPGVVDLLPLMAGAVRAKSLGASGIFAFGASLLAGNPGHARTTKNATAGNLGGYDQDQYAQAVMSQMEQFMQDNGLPRGMDVAIVGHSYGSIAAGNLVSNPQFNGGLVNVTHWMPTAAGQQFEAVPAGTSTLAVNNVVDPVVGLGLLGNLTAGASASGSSPSVIQGFGGFGGMFGFGHPQSVYTNLISGSAGDAPAEAWFSAFGSKYGGPTAATVDLDAREAGSE